MSGGHGDFSQELQAEGAWAVGPRGWRSSAMVIHAALPDVVVLTAGEQRAVSDLSEQLVAHAGPGARVLVADPNGRRVSLAVGDPAVLAAARLFRPGKPVTV